jgi:hypothetical protein
MTPRVPDNFLEILRHSGKEPPWVCKLHLRKGRTVYAVEISAAGEIKRVGERVIYSASDIGFDTNSVERINPYLHPKI